MIRAQGRNKRRGFTLMEIMIVIVIIGLVSSITAVAVRGFLATARVRTAKMQISKISNALDTYNASKASYPTQEMGLAKLNQPIEQFATGILSPADLKDPWGSDFEYFVPGNENRPFEIVCIGPDKIAGTEDDFSSDDIE